MTPPKVASQRVADIVAERIISGALKPGEHIKQDELAKELEVSRIPVRDALRMLEARGLVTLKANSGARVISHSLKDLDMFYQVRQVIEPMLLERSLPLLTDEDIAEIADAKARLDAITDVDEYLPLQTHFFWLILRRHDTPVLKQINDRLWDTMNVYRLAFAELALSDPERRKVLIAERDLLFGSIERREHDLAPRILALHIRRAHLALLEHIKDVGQLPAR